jgi:hypothetical protein
MSTPISPSAKTAQAERIQANLKTIYCAHRKFDTWAETDDWEYYLCYLREDLGDRFGNILLTTTSDNGPDGAWKELGGILERKAQATKQGTDHME